MSAIGDRDAAAIAFLMPPSLSPVAEGGKNMYIIAGLGNPTAQYRGTRHNVGFEVIDYLADKYNIDVTTKKLKGQDPATQDGIAPTINMSLRPTYSFNLNVSF